jgi:hypothetical protein
MPRTVTLVPPFWDPLAGEILVTVGAATKVYRSSAVTGLSVKSSADIRMLTGPAVWVGTRMVQLVVLEHVAVTHFVPISAISAPAMGRKPEPVTVRVLDSLAAPMDGEILLT